MPNGMHGWAQWPTHFEPSTEDDWSGLQKIRGYLKGAVAETRGKEMLRFSAGNPITCGRFRRCLEDLGVAYDVFPADRHGNRVEYDVCETVALVVKDDDFVGAKP